MEISYLCPCGGSLQALTGTMIDISLFENWKASLDRKDAIQAYEFGLFTDAEILGDEYSIGPLILMNTSYGPWGTADKLLRPSLTVRANIFKEFNPYHIPNMERTIDNAYHGGDIDDEIAAMTSLILGIRLKAGPWTREFNRQTGPSGYPAYYTNKCLPQLLSRQSYPTIPSTLNANIIDMSLLSHFPSLTKANAASLIKAARQYQEALWVSDSDPSLAWVMMVSAIETAANHWRMENDKPIKRLRASKPELHEYLRNLLETEQVERVAEMIAVYMGATKKFIDFLIEFNSGPPKERPAPECQISFETKDLRKILSKVYQYRSQALHGGKPFPLPMCLPPQRLGSPDIPAEKPLGLATSSLGATWDHQDTPIMLHTFEFLARKSLLNWWNSMTKKVQ